MRAFVRVAVVFIAVSLSSCYEEGDLVVHEPGVYKGNNDPLLTQSAQDRASTLSERFAKVQMDR